MNILAGMDISEAQGWLLVIGAIVAAVTSVAGVIVSTVNSIRLGRTEKKVDVQTVKQEEQGESIKVIGVATDGALHALKQTNQIAADRNVQLEEALKVAGAEVPLETKQTAHIPQPAPVHVEDEVGMPAQKITPTKKPNPPKP